MSFDEEDFFKRVFDPYYVKTSEYSDLLVHDIPKRQRANVAITTILRRNDGDINSLGYFLTSLLKKLEGAELSRVYKVVSDELRTTTLNKDIRYLVHICPGKYWLKIEESARLRTESILYEDFSQGTYNLDSEKCGSHGALASWITADHLKNFSKLTQWTSQTINMLTLGGECSNYIENYFWIKICEANKVAITWPLENYLKKALCDGNQEVIKKLEEEIRWDENHPWWQVFEEELKKYPQIIVIDYDYLFS